MQLWLVEHHADTFLLLLWIVNFPYTHLLFTYDEWPLLDLGARTADLDLLR